MNDNRYYLTSEDEATELRKLTLSKGYVFFGNRVMVDDNNKLYVNVNINDGQQYIDSISINRGKVYTKTMRNNLLKEALAGENI